MEKRWDVEFIEETAHEDSFTHSSDGAWTRHKEDILKLK
jgi:hypothetical protein